MSEKSEKVSPRSWPPESGDVDPILRLPEIHEMTGVPIATLRFYRANSEGPRMFKLGGRLVAKRSDVLAWIQAQYEASA